uniref:two-component system response regulator n=1 Tax=Cellvibrio fontiphilus TaxID=1815559 RepID=UPI002B4C06BB|nr:diguanylate cyclase [Cellvibrio fontiphilus]
MDVLPTTVLLIEDDPITATCIQESLMSNKNLFCVVWVMSLHAAEDYLSNNLADIILLDLNLPDVKGIAGLKKILALAPTAQILVLSDSGDNELIYKALECGAQDYIIKGYIDTHWLPRILSYIIQQLFLEKSLHELENALFDQQERAQITLNSIGDGVLTTNLSGKIMYLNRVAETMTGWSLQEALGLPLGNVFSVIDAGSRQAPPNPVRCALKANTTVKLPNNCLLVRRDGVETPIEDSIAPIRNRTGAISGAVIVFHDVSEARALAIKIMHMAQHDALTGLANRSLLSERLTRALGLAKRTNKKIGLLFLDVDNFKSINDAHGHAVGDELLKVVARRLESVVRVTDTVCRQGGDEFVILLTQIEHSEDAGQVATKVITVCAEAEQGGGKEAESAVTMSIGISIFPDDGKSVDALLQHADRAMYHAKMCGRNNYQFYNNSIDLPSASTSVQHHANTRS